MKRLFLTLAFLAIAPAAQAATINSLDLTLRLERSGFTDVVIYDDDLNELSRFGFLDVLDDRFGLSQPYSPFDVGGEQSLTATQDYPSNELTVCALGGLSCVGAFGNILSDSFSLGDGAGFTAFGDFALSGGTAVGSIVTLSSFEGPPVFEPLRSGGFASWDRFDQQFLVVSNNLVVAPLPASLPFLAVALGGFGFLRRKRMSLTAQA